jgi:hypothetical protein
VGERDSVIGQNPQRSGIYLRADEYRHTIILRGVVFRRSVLEMASP